MDKVLLSTISFLSLFNSFAFSQKIQNQNLELNIFKVTDTELPPNSNHYAIEKSIYFTIDNKDVENYKFDSAWYFLYPNSYPRNPHYLILDHGVKEMICSNDTCIIKSFYTPDNGSTSTVGIPTQYQPNPYRTPFKIHQIKGPNKLKETARLYYNYKGKWRVARFTNKIIYTPTETERYNRDYPRNSELSD